MKIIIDENMFSAYKLFSYLGEVKSLPGRSISRSELNNADALMISSVTKANKALLSETSIKFVGTATSGVDHVDDAWLRQSDIGFSYAPGCNAISVVEYVLSSLLVLAERNGFTLKDQKVGIVGVGNIGGCLQKRLKAIGVHVLLCDPPRFDRGDEEDFLSLDELIEQVDILTFHTPLFKEGPYKTFHLVNEDIINRLRPGCILINTCRGEIIDNIVLLKYLEEEKDLTVVLDVWEQEPNINIDLLKKVDIGTAHIAGYSLEGKARGTKKIFEDYSIFINKPRKVEISTLLPIPIFHRINLHGSIDESIIKRLVHLLYDVRRDDSMLRTTAGMPNAFDKLRKNYAERREWSSLHITCDNKETVSVLHALGFNSHYCNI